MGQIVTSVIGAVGGFLIGGPMGAAIGFQMGGMIGGTLFGPSIKGPRLSDLKVSASTYGNAIPEIWGTVRIGGNMIWTTGIKEKKKKKSAGKGGPKVTTYTYSCTFAIALCKGPIDGITRIWADGKLIYDMTGGDSTGSIFGDGTFPELLTGAVKGLIGKGNNANSGNKYRVRIYKGDEEQLPDSLIVADKGAENVSAMRGLAYLVFEKMALEDFGNRVPQITVEVTRVMAKSFPSLVTEAIDGGDFPMTQGYFVRPDWENGRFFAGAWDYIPDHLIPTTYVGDLDSMSVQYTLPMATGGTFAPELDMTIQYYGGGNSKAMHLWSLSGGTEIATIGKGGNGLFGTYLSDGDKGDYVEQYGANGVIGYTYADTAMGRRGFVVRWNSWGKVFAFAVGDRTPLFMDVPPEFTPERTVVGHTGPDYAEVFGYRPKDGAVQISSYRIGANAAATTVETGLLDPKYIWQRSGDWSRLSATMNPFADPFTLHVILFDRSDDHIFCAGHVNDVPATFKYSLDTGQYKFAVIDEDARYPYHPCEYSRLAGGEFGYFSGHNAAGTTGSLWTIDLQTGKFTNAGSYTASAWGPGNAFRGGMHWDDVTQSMVFRAGNLLRRVWFRSAGARPQVSDIVREICLRSGVLTESDIDITALNDDSIIGYTIDRECTARDALKQVATGYLFDAFESDYKLKFKSRGSEPAVTIPEDWMSRNEEGIVVRETITQELEMPMRLSVNYYDIARSHQQGSQHAKRNVNPISTMMTPKEVVVDLPIVWNSTDGKRCAEKLLKMTWANRWSYETTLPWRYLKYDPTDVVTAAMEDGTQFTIRISDFNIGADFSIQMRGVSEKATAYLSTAEGSADLGIPSRVVVSSYPVKPVIINTPLLRDLDYTTTGAALTYVSATTNSMSFNGAYVYMSDGIVDESPIASVEAEATVGYVVNKLPATTSYEATDETTVLMVRLAGTEADLESVTQEAMLTSYANAALVGKELIQFRDAVQEADGSWSISGILRARRGTNYAVNDHTAGEQFILLDEESVDTFTRPPELYETTRSFRAVSPGGSLGLATAVGVELVPRDLMPYTPEDFRISDDGTNVTIMMQRRSRVTAPLTDGSGVIHYKEDDKTTASIQCEVWANLALADAGTSTPPTFTGSAPLFENGLDIAEPEYTFPLDSLGGQAKFLLKAYETGVVDGIPKWIAFERIDQDRWNLTELY